MSESAAIYPKKLRLALLIILLLYGTLWWMSQGKLIYTDETVFAMDFARVSAGRWSEVVIPHPPLYIGLGGIAVALSGSTFVALRLPGGIAYILTLCLIPLAIHSLVGNRTVAVRASWIALVIFALQPLLLQGSLLLDIDNTILTSALLLYFIAVGRTEKSAVWVRIASVALSFALLLWTKLLPTPLLLIASTLLIYLPRARLFLSTLVGILTGILLFAITLAVFATAVGFPLEVFLPTFQRIGAPVQSGVGRLVSRAVMGGGITAVWMGIPFVFGYFLVVVRRVRAWFRGRRLYTLDILLVCSLAGMFLFSIGNELPMGFPRYHYPIFLMMVILVSVALAEEADFVLPPAERTLSSFVWLGAGGSCA